MRRSKALVVATAANAAASQKRSCMFQQLYANSSSLMNYATRRCYSNNSTFTTGSTINFMNSANASSATTPTAHYDLICIGGGSGGLACAKQAAKEAARQNLQLKIAVIDDRKANPAHPVGLPWRWGLGGVRCASNCYVLLFLTHHLLL